MYKEKVSRNTNLLEITYTDRLISHNKINAEKERGAIQCYLLRKRKLFFSHSS